MGLYNGKSTIAMENPRFLIGKSTPNGIIMGLSWKSTTKLVEYPQLSMGCVWLYIITLQ